MDRRPPGLDGLVTSTVLEIVLRGKAAPVKLHQRYAPDSQEA